MSAMSAQPAAPVYGQITCQAVTRKGTPCTNYAYYSAGTDNNVTYRCGVHSKEGARVMLRKDAGVAAARIQSHDATVEIARKSNRESGNRGSITVSKMPMIKSPPRLNGYINVYPNYKHGNRKDGLGMPSLSPKSLGPVNHVMPNLPPAESIENYHQFAKFWDFELDPTTDLPTQEALEYRIAAYQSRDPQRHKHSKDLLKKLSKNGNPNIPTYSLYYTRNGEPRKYDYLQCRYFYCHYYEQLAPLQPEFRELQEKLKDGYNINIVGYDGYTPLPDTMKMYLDTTKPFGHEMVLYCLLIGERPWETYREQQVKQGMDPYKDMFK